MNGYSGRTHQSEHSCRKETEERQNNNNEEAQRDSDDLKPNIYII